MNILVGRVRPSHGVGYWISDDPDEIIRYCQEARRDARKAYRTRIASVRALERGAKRLLEVGGQIEFQI